MPVKSTWCENYHLFALTKVGGRAVESTALARCWLSLRIPTL